MAALLLTLFRPPAIDAQGGIRSVYECVAWTLPAVLLVDVLRARALGYGKYGVAVAERWTAGIVRFIAVVVCFLAGWLESVVVAVLASWLPGLVVGLVLHLASGRRSTDGAALAEADAGKIASYAARSWASSVVGLALIRATEVYMAANSTATQLGLFVIAAAVADVPILALSAVRDIVVRTLSRPEVDFAARLGLMLRVVGGLSVGSSIAIVLAAPVLVPLVFGRDYGPAVAVVQVLVVATIGNSLSSVLFAGLAARDRPQAQVVAQLFGLAAMIPGLVLSVPTFGALGAAATVAVAQLVTAFAAFVITARSMAFPMMALLVPNRGDVRAVIYVLKPGKTT
ncbi:lipopolysaccharide biosynthesis protein [Cellulomonas marina]|uniref:lipopolysaccharide biosynthesis protein n=1 Tax=Cellulomonas marina TaxID=988821 RepID=UPI001113AF8F|nr:polysaccharide biosynthesis C-terminal domain-containing protein [Cellulomonas marina]